MSRQPTPSIVLPSQPTASILVPTRDRAGYLGVALASIAPQASAAGAEIIVINDGGDDETDRVSRDHGAKVIAQVPPRGINAARNTGIEAARAELIVLVDDDVEAPAGWLSALLAGAASAPHADVLGGPIRARLEGGGPRACGRETAPITTLDLGPVDRDVPLVWGANMALRRSALTRAGLFDQTMSGPGDEEDWERRYRARDGVVRYVAAAGLDHRRAASDATVRKLASAAYAQGRGARLYDARKGVAPSPAAEARILIGCLWHAVRRRCAIGIVMAAQAGGRLREALAAPAARARRRR